MMNNVDGHEVITKRESQMDWWYAGFWMRFWAYLLDLLVIASINGMFIRPIFRAADLSLTTTGVFTPINIACAIVFYSYFVLMTKKFGQTLGKMVFGLKVVSLDEEQLSWGKIIFREWIGRYISATFIFLYVIAAFTPKKQAIHDFIADTTVVHEQRQTVKPAY